LLIFMKMSAEMMRIIVEYIIGVTVVKTYAVRFTVSLKSLIYILR